MGFRRLPDNRAKKINPLRRDRDNSNDLETAELKVHSKYKGLQAPKESAQFNNTTRTAP